jgi:NTE family protein
MDPRALAARAARRRAALPALLALAAVAAASGAARAQGPAPAPDRAARPPVAAASASAEVPPPVPAAGPAAVAAPAGAHRPKVCLVLSGGGARGAAHLGVLQVLEEMHVPVDCVVGTSMGSIVGGAYASGTSLEAMEDTLSQITTRLLFKDLPPREERAVRLKKDDATDLIPFEIGVQDGDLVLPKGIVSGVQLESVLRSLSKVRGARSFDSLPIPFRAVATDLSTGKPVVLTQGELASAMRASMSVPGLMNPLAIDGRLLVDGGLTDNLPVDVARSMGAEIVIAVNLGTPLMKPDEIKSVLDVTGQMVNILTEQNVQASLASLKPTDVLVLPQLGDFSAADFDHLPVTVPIGVAAARQVADRLAALSVPPAEYEAWRQHRLAGLPPQIGEVDEVRLSPMKFVNPDIARQEIHTQPGEPIDEAALDRDMKRLFGTGDFEHVSYRIFEEPGRRVLYVDAPEKPWGPDYLRVGLGLSSDFRGDAFFDLLASYRKTWVNSLGAEWRTDAQVGNTDRIATEFYQPLEQTRTFFVDPAAAYERRVLNLYEGSQRIAQLDFDEGRFGLELGAQFTRYGELRLGVSHLDQRAEILTGPPSLSNASGKAGFTLLSLRGAVDQLDNVNFPRSGYAGSFALYSGSPDQRSDPASGGDPGSGSELGCTESPNARYQRGEMNGSAVGSLGENTFSFAFKRGFRMGNEPLPCSQFFQWGGLLQQSGYPTGALLGGDLSFARIVYDRRIAHFSLLEGLYGGLSLEVGKMRNPLVAGNEPGTLRSIAAFLGVDTPIGPLYLGYGFANHGYESLYLFLGRP